MKKQFRRITAGILAMLMVISSPISSLAEVKTASPSEATTEYETASLSNASYDEEAVVDDAGNISTNTEAEQSDEAKMASPSEAEEIAFNQSQMVDGIVITVTADKGVFPKRAKLKVSKVINKKDLKEIDAAVEEVREEDKNVASSNTFDIQILNEKGNEIQPDNSKGTVNVKFSLAEKLNEVLDVAVYHVSEATPFQVEETETTETDEEGVLLDGKLTDDVTEDNEEEKPEETPYKAEALETEITEKKKTTEVEVKTESFSVYVVEFTYGNLEYVLEGDTSVGLYNIQEELGLKGEVTAAISSNTDCISVEKNPWGNYYTISVIAGFDTETLKIEIGDKAYNIILTYKVIADELSGKCGDYAKWLLKPIEDNKYELIISGTGKMRSYGNSAQAPWYKYRDKISKLIIYNGIETIGNYAFSYCGIKTVKLPTSLNSIGDYAFDSCAALEKITIPNNVKTIGKKAFSYCNSMNNATILSAGITLGEGIFENCINLNKAVFAKGVYNLKATFKNCYSLETFIVPESVNKIDIDTFVGCSSLSSVIIPNSKTAIEKGAFTYPNNVTLYGYEGSTTKTFAKQNGFAFKNIAEGQKYSITYVLNGGINHPSNPLSYGNLYDVTVFSPTRQGYTFDGWYTDSDFSFGPITKIQAYLYEDITLYAKWLRNPACGEDVVYDYDPDKGILTLVGTGPMWDYSEEESFIDKTAKEIKQKYGTTSTIKSIEILDGITRIGDYAFPNTTIQSLMISDTVEEIGKYAFSKTSVKGAFAGCHGVKTIGDYGFEGFVDTGGAGDGSRNYYADFDSLVSIGDYAFYRCKLPGSRLGDKKKLVSIGKEAFRNSQIHSVVLGNGLETIKTYTFYEAKARNFIIPDSVKVIERYAFCGFDNSRTIGNRNTMEDRFQWGTGIERIDDYAFSRVYLDDRDAVWTFPNCVTIGNGAFDCAEMPNVYGNVGSYDIVLPKIVRIGYDAFRGIDMGSVWIKSVEISEKAEYIGAMAFYSQACDLIIKSKNVEIGGKAYGYAYSGREYKIASGLLSISGHLNSTAQKYAEDNFIPFISIDPEPHKLYFDSNGGDVSISSKQVVPGSPYGTLPIPTRKGYTFAGWYTSKKSGELVTEEKIVPSCKEERLYAIWTSTKYKITYNLNGGKNSTSNPSSYYVTTSTITLKNPTRTGYTFGGWYSDSKLTKKATTTIKKGSTGNKTFYAKWTANAYKIAFNANGGTGTAPKTISTSYGKTVTLTANPFKRTGYTFTGWNTKKDGKGTAYANKASVKNLTSKSGATVTLYAQWKVNSYKIAFNANGGTGTAPKTISTSYGKTVTLTANPFKKTGYAFTGWNTKADGKGTKYANKASVKNLTSTNGKTVTLYAQWSKTKYTIKYTLNGGKNSTSNPSSYYITTSTITLKNPTRTGYTFGGWYSDSKYKTKVTSIKKGSTGNKTFYAKWSATKYTITYSLNGGTNSAKNPEEYTITTADIKLANPTKTGYTFGGWYSDSKYKTKVTTIKKGSTGNKTFYAKWTANKYTIAFNANGGSGSMSKMTGIVYGSSKALTANKFTRKNYTFQGWSTSKTGDVKYANKASVKNLTSKNGATVTLYAIWKADTYTIAFNANGGTGSMSKLTVGVASSKALTANAFEKTGYTFEGWSTSKTGSVKYKNKATVKGLTTKGKTITLYAVWKIMDGWQQIDGCWYYYENLKPVKDAFRQSGNDYYYLGPDGKMETNKLIKYKDEKYYVDKDGRMSKNTWCYVADMSAWMFFGDDGKAFRCSQPTYIVAFKFETGKTHYFDYEGRLTDEHGNIISQDILP